MLLVLLFKRCGYVKKTIILYLVYTSFLFIYFEILYFQLFVFYKIQCSNIRLDLHSDIYCLLYFVQVSFSFLKVIDVRSDRYTYRKNIPEHRFKVVHRRTIQNFMMFTLCVICDPQLSFSLTIVTVSDSCMLALFIQGP
jgi:hypothetical protein